MAYRGKIPGTVKLRVKERWGYFYVLARNGKGWVTLDKFKPRNTSEREKKRTWNDALAFREDYHTNDDFRWSIDVKIRAGWVCEECGELDRELLESHHIEPREVKPELAHDLNNGRCLCLWCHAWTGHKDNNVVRNMILARLALKLYGRLYPKKKEEIQAKKAG